MTHPLPKDSWACECGHINGPLDEACTRCSGTTRLWEGLEPLETATSDLNEPAPGASFRQAARPFDHNLPPIPITVTAGGATPTRVEVKPKNRVDEEDLLPMKPRWFANVDPEAVFKWIVGVGAVVLGIVGLIALFSSRRDTVQVRAIHWERTRAIEVLREHQEEDWEDDIPAEGYNKRNCESRDHGSESCNCRRDSNGRETCDSCTVYDNWCQYTIRAWDRTWEARLDGWSHTERWPTVDQRVIDRAGADATRVVNESEYAVQFEGSSRMWRRKYDLETFQRFEIGDRYQVTWSHAGEFRLGRRVARPE